MTRSRTATRPLAQDGGAATDRRLDAWSDVLALCEAAGITMIAAFDARFPLTQSLYNWSQDLEMELGNAGHDDPAKLQATGSRWANRTCAGSPTVTS
jgi:hypothetical protein